MAYKILIVEDEAATSLDLEIRLAAMGYEVTGTFSQAEHALVAAKTQRPDLVLTDINLAGKMDGITLAHLLRERMDIPSVFLTAFATDASLEKAKRSLPLAYLIKPYSETMLRCTLEVALNNMEADRQLRSNKAELDRFKTTLDFTHDAVFMFDPESFLFFYVNQGACTLTGLTVEELQASRPYNLLTEHDEEKFLELIAPLKKGSQSSLRIETKLQRKNGKKTPVEVFLQFISPKGQPPRFVGVFTDITARTAAARSMKMKLRAEMLSQREQLSHLRLEKLIVEVGVALNSVQPLEEILENCARAFTDHMDLALARIWTTDAETGALLLQASAGRNTAPEGYHRHIPPGNNGIASIAKNRTRLFEVPVVSIPQDFPPKWLEQEKVEEFAGFPLLVEHNVVGVMAVYLRERLTAGGQRALDTAAGQIALGIHRKWMQKAMARSAEQKIEFAFQGLKQALDGSGDATIIRDKEKNTVLFANQAAKNLFVLADLQENAELDLVVITLGVTEVDVPQRDGSVKVVEMRAGQSYWMDRKSEILTFRDVTERITATTLLSKARDEAIQASNAKSDFLATMSHEIRTPLTAMRGFTQTLLSDDDMPAELRREFLQTVHEQSINLSHLVNEFLDLSSIESGRSSFDDKPIDLLEISEESVRTFKPLAESRSLQMKSVFPPQLPPFTGDPKRLRSVFHNLLGNAVKYTEENGAIKLTVELRDNQILVEVWNSGPVIPAGELTAIFKEFYRQQCTTETQEGTGLGLPIVKAIVNHYGGEIDLTSDEASGTSFKVSLPLEPKIRGNALMHGAYELSTAP